MKQTPLFDTILEESGRVVSVETLQHLGDQDNAGKALEQAVKLDPEDPAIRANYAAYWVNVDQPQRALEELNTFNALAQRVPNICPEVSETLQHSVYIK